MNSSFHDEKSTENIRECLPLVINIIIQNIILRVATTFGTCTYGERFILFQ